MKRLYLLVAVLVFAGCNRLTPAGFWKSFDSRHIVKNISDQGPYGGYRVIYWQNKQKKYNESTILKFAKDNGWKLTEKQVINSDVMKYWTFDNIYIFPLSSDGLDIKTTKHNEQQSYKFPRWIQGGGVIYKFKSGWTVVNNDISKDAFGYVLLSSDKTQLSIYHLWGE